MAYRIPALSCIRALGVPTAKPPLLRRQFSSTAAFQAKLSEKDKLRKRASHDPYLVAQRNRKKAANLSRRAELEQGRKDSLGDPVRGRPTPFVESFDTGNFTMGKNETPTSDGSQQLNYAFVPEVVEAQLQRSRELAVPLGEIGKQKPSGPYQWSDDLRYGRKHSQMEKSPQEIESQSQDEHITAKQAISRITALENGSSKDRMRVNIAHCVEAFGRHNTDKVLPPRAPSLQRLVTGEEIHPVRSHNNMVAAEKRVGPDTGSSEVQIAILTAKIRTLADFLVTRGRRDKHNKRNLRLLVHRRQKLLQYLRRKERGGPRWQHCVETLGLTEGTWKGEISM